MISASLGLAIFVCRLELVRTLRDSRPPWAFCGRFAPLETVNIALMKSSAHHLSGYIGLALVNKEETNRCDREGCPSGKSYG